MGDERRTEAPRAIYILANDHVLEFASALFRSLRHYNEEIPAFLIPFDDRIEKVAREARSFDVTLWEDPCLGELDALGTTYLGESGAGARMFRKFATFWGPAERFLYIDVDCVFLSDPAVLFDELDRAACEFLTFDNDETRAYLHEELRSEMQRRYGSRSFNAGAFLSRRGSFDLETLRRLGRQAREVRHHFAPHLGDQPFFNFAVDVSRLRQKRLPEINTSYPDKEWGDQAPIRWQNGAFRLMDPASPDHAKALPFVHWAGHDAGENFPNREIFYHFRLMGMPMKKRIEYRMRDRWTWSAARLQRTVAWSRHKGVRLSQKLGLGQNTVGA